MAGSRLQGQAAILRPLEDVVPLRDGASILHGTDMDSLQVLFSDQSNSRRIR